jgi:pyruvate-formate lyase-activating enzyme
MKRTIRTLISKIPLAKTLYNAVKQSREELRRWRVQAKLRKKQPIIWQGSSECFEGLPLRVSWNVTSHCNFRCSYCFNAGKEYKKVFCTLEQVKTAIRHIALANRPSYQINLMGGEPTSHPHLDEIINLLCQYLGNRLEVLQITTNGSFSESQMKAILKAGEQVNVQLSISVHLEYMNVERVVEMVKRYSSRTRLEIALMFHPELIDKVMSMADALCDLRREYSFWMYPSLLREGPQFNQFDSRYTQEHFNIAERIKKKFSKVNSEGPQRPENQQEILGWKFMVKREVRGVTENHEQISLSELKDLTGNSFKGMTCIAGTNCAKIGVDGSVKGIICGLDRPTCNIFEENPFLREDWIHGVFCTQTMCGCNVNYRIPKFKSPAAAQRFIAEKRLEQKKLMSVKEM